MLEAFILRLFLCNMCTLFLEVFLQKGNQCLGILPIISMKIIVALEWVKKVIVVRINISIRGHSFYWDKKILQFLSDIHISYGYNWQCLYIARHNNNSFTFWFDTHFKVSKKIFWPSKYIYSQNHDYCALSLWIKVWMQHH